MAWTFSGGHGSSINRRFSGSTSFTITEATLGLVFAWKSTAMSMSGPSDSRSTCMLLIAAETARVERAPEKLVHRNAERFPANVPQRLVDGRHGRAHHRSCPVEAMH